MYDFCQTFDFSFIWDSDIFSLGRTGLVHLFINKWIEIWFCLPHKIHQIPDSSAVLKIEVRILFYILLEQHNFNQKDLFMNELHSLFCFKIKVHNCLNFNRKQNFFLPMQVIFMKAHIPRLIDILLVYLLQPEIIQKCLECLR